jgi:hypothetical protein
MTSKHGRNLGRGLRRSFPVHCSRVDRERSAWVSVAELVASLVVVGLLLIALYG